MNTTLPGYEIVFVENLPKKPKPKESFSWVLKLPAEEFPSKDSLESQAFNPRALRAQNTQTELLSEFRSPCETFPPCLLEADALAEVESRLPEAEGQEENLPQGAEMEAKVSKAPSFQFNPNFNAKSKLRAQPLAQRTAPEFVSNTHEYSGPLLGEVRCFHGMTLGELASATRVAQHHLQNIERERYDSLPAIVYLRGYLKSVARELGLDMQLVSQSYLDRMQQAKS